MPKSQAEETCTGSRIVTGIGAYIAMTVVTIMFSCFAYHFACKGLCKRSGKSAEKLAQPSYVNPAGTPVGVWPGVPDEPAKPVDKHPENYDSRT